jgi:PilZ domain
MNPTTAWTEQPQQIDRFAEDRRYSKRYELQLELRWKLIRRRRVLETGVGQTVDLSSSGISFDAGRALPVGLNVELSVSWPVLLRNVAPLQLVVSGRIVRADGRRTVIRMAQHEFRTMGVVSERRNTTPIPFRGPSSLIPSFSGITNHGKLQ